MTATPDQILDQLSAIIEDLGSIREQVTESIDRSAINSQIKALSKWWRKIDLERAKQSGVEMEDAKAALEQITQDLSAEKKQLTQVAKAIHRGAQAIAIAEKVAKTIA